MTDETSDSESALIDRIIRHEGFCEFPKPDAKGMYVIGYGHDIYEASAKVDYPQGITQESALVLLESDINKAKNYMAKEMPFALELSEVRQEVIIEMIFQLGVWNVLKFHKMVAAIIYQDWDAAAHEMLNSSWHLETPSRCEELAGYMLKGEL